MKVKIILIIVGVILLVSLLILVLVSLPWLAIYFGSKANSNPTQPEITYGEFPFKLEYEINGENIVIEDTLICEFEGFIINAARGKYAKWNERLASGNNRVTLLWLDDESQIYYNPGHAKYYLGVLEPYENFEHLFPNAIIIEKISYYTEEKIIKEDELLETYGIKLLNWEPSPPIINSFK